MTVSNLHTRPFKKLLVANRGEIAIRIMRACRDLGVQTVAIYSEADRTAPHVRYADEAYFIGEPPASKSYLVMERIIDVAKKSGADAIHPGYGFLSERADFAEACFENDLVFVGPSPQAIRVMGDKLTARDTAVEAGVPIVPGTSPGLTDEQLIATAAEIGYPLLVKASAGGGGKGMRPVSEESILLSSIEAARREAISSFGDGTVYIERMILQGRHIEIQVLADAHGNVVHLGERECSLQRRHQKLLEESPSMAVSAETRAEMGRVACAAAATVDYVGVGTIEFLMDDQERFYFLEMNTRLQVEHPVTELVTGIDLAKEQLRVAMGEEIGYSQEDIKQTGWSFECRINAEDPFGGFIPSTGTLEHVTSPMGPGIRVDTGVFEGYEITPYYDSMISKLISYGSSREEARLRMLRALDEYKITGVTTNIPFHIAVMNDERFIDGAFHTKFVEDDFNIEESYQKKLAVQAAVAAALTEYRTGGTTMKLDDGQSKGSASAWKWRSWKHG